MKGPSGKDSGYRKRRWWTLTSRLWQSLSPHSVCEKSPNLLAALLPPPDLSWNNAGGQCSPEQEPVVPWGIRPKKECIKSCEICFANTLNLNDKGPCMKWVCSPKFYGPLANWPWLRISPQTSLNVIYCLIITAWQWLSFMYMPVQIKHNKRPLRNRLLALLLWEIGHLSTPSRACPGRLILIRGGQGGGRVPLREEHPLTKPYVCTCIIIRLKVHPSKDWNYSPPLEEKSKGDEKVRKKEERKNSLLGSSKTQI